MMEKKNIIIIALIALASLMIGPVSAEADYSFWDDHYLNCTNVAIQDGPPPFGTIGLYSDTESFTTPTYTQFKTEYGIPDSIPTYVYTRMFLPDNTNVGYYSWGSTNINPALTISGSFIDGPYTTPRGFTAADDGLLLQSCIPGGLGPIWYTAGPAYLYHHFETPIISEFTYTPAEPWIAPANVTFTYLGTGKKADQWHWRISRPGFDIIASGEPSINATLPYPGSYDVELTVVNGTVEDTEIKTFTVVNEAGSYSLIMSPETGTTATNFTAAITAGVDSLGAVLNQFTISCTESGKNSYCTVDGKDPVFVKQNDGNWYLDGDLYSATFPANISLKFNIPGTHTVKAWFFTSDPTDTGTEVSDTVTVTSSPGQIKLTVEVRDAGTNAIIGGPDILMKKEDGTWDNQTVGLGFRDYYVNGGNNIGIGATAPGYTDSAIEYTRFYADAKKVVLLSRIPDAVPEGNNTLSVYVRKGGGSDVIGLEGATVKLNDGQTKLTPGSGLAQFLVLDGKTYFITVSKTGYVKMVRNLAVSGSVNSITMDMLPEGATTAPTLAPGETPAPGTTTLAPGTTYPPGVPMPGTTITYPPGVPIIGGDGSTVATNGTARDIAVQNLETWMIWGGTAFAAIFGIMFIGFSGDALKKWSWLWK